MSENNYGALMMKSAVAAGDDINAIVQPGIYIIPPANNSSPDATGGVLAVHTGTPIRRTFTSDSVIALVSTKNDTSWTPWKRSQPLDATLTNLSGKDVAGLLQYLGLNAFHSDPNFSSVSSPTAKVFFFVTDSGDWGVQDSIGNPLSLPMDRGGTGANTQLGARINLLVQALTSGKDLTTLSSPTAKYFLYIDNNGAWGVQDSEGHSVPLSVEGGGSGERTLPALKLKLGLGAFNTTDEYSSVSSPTAKVFLFIEDGGSWGVQDSGGNSIPLPIECGGTGERTLLGARVKLGVDVVGKTDLLTTLSSPDASRSLFITNGVSWGLQTSEGDAIPLPMDSGGLGAVTPKGGRDNLGLKTAAVRDVGTGANQIPDMSAFPGSAQAKGYTKLPNGLLLQWGKANIAAANAASDVSIDNFAISFPNGVLQCYATGGATLTDTPCFVSAEAIDKNQIRLKAVSVDLPTKTITQGQLVPVSWFAIGA